MPITMTCPGCKALFRLPEELAGKQVRCQKCAELFDVPLPLTGMPSALEAPMDEPILAPIAAAAMANDEPILAPIAAAAMANDEPILATVIGDAAPKDEPVRATVEEPSEKAADTEAKPARRKALPPDRPASVAMIVAMIFLFLSAMLGTGTFAAIWVAGHLSPPLPLTVVPPLHVGGNGNFNGGFQGNGNQGDRFNWDKDWNLKDPDGLPRELRPEPLRFKAPERIIMTVGEKPDRRALTAKDPVDPLGTGPYKLYYVPLEAGHLYVFDMKTNAFPPHLSLFDPNNRRVSDGIGRAANHSQLTYRPTRTGTYTVHAASINDDRGPYTLTIRRQL